MVLQVEEEFGWACGFAQTEIARDMLALWTDAIKGLWNVEEGQRTRN